MKMRTLGRSGLQLAPLALGGNVFGWTVDEATSFALMDAFVDAGFNFMDTADSYSRWVPGNRGGESETIIGRWLRRRPGMRHRVLLATKVGSDMGEGLTGLRKAYVLQAAEQSLQRLDTDYIDLYQSHCEDPGTPVGETLDAYAQLIQQGKVRAIGASNLSVPALADALHVSAANGYPRYESLQSRYNLYDRQPFEGAMSDLCQTETIGVIPHSSLAGGFLTGKYRSEADLGATARGRIMKSMPDRNPLNERGLRVLAALDTVAAGISSTPTQVSLAWVLARGATAALASATSIEQLNELSRAATLDLSQNALRLLDEASNPVLDRTEARTGT